MARSKSGRAAAKEAQESSSHLVRSERWNGLRAGDPVEVAGFTGRATTWEFRAHVLNERNGSESVEVVGGGAGERMVRSFSPDRIFAPTGRSRGAGQRMGAATATGTRSGARTRRSTASRPSLADAPQLPFG